MRWRPAYSAFVVWLWVLAATSCTAADPPAGTPAASASGGAPEGFHAYHGMLLDGGLRPIALTDANASRLLDPLIDGAQKGWSPRQRDAYQDRASRLRALIAVSPELEVHGKMRIAAWVVSQSPKDVAASDRDRVHALGSWILGLPSAKAARLRSAELDALGPSRVDRPDADESYRSRCRAAGVPDPPDWGDKAWTFQGLLDGRYVFAGLGDDITEVWSYSDTGAPGACIALPRRDAGTKHIRVLGIICQSKVTGQACFWDNKDRHTGEPIKGPDAEAMKIDRLQDGDLLGENCTNCHRGKYVFVVHPRTGLDVRRLAIDPDRRYAPISAQRTWANPAVRVPEGEGPCGECHEVPVFAEAGGAGREIGSSYCGVLQQAAELTMPSLTRPAGWTFPEARYAPHVDAFRRACTGGP